MPEETYDALVIGGRNEHLELLRMQMSEVVLSMSRHAPFRGALGRHNNGQFIVALIMAMGETDAVTPVDDIVPRRLAALQAPDMGVDLRGYHQIIYRANLRPSVGEVPGVTLSRILQFAPVGGQLGLNRNTVWQRRPHPRGRCLGGPALRAQIAGQVQLRMVNRDRQSLCNSMGSPFWMNCFDLADTHAIGVRAMPLGLPTKSLMKPARGWRPHAQ